MRVHVWRAPGSPTPGSDYADRVVGRLAAAGLDAEVRPLFELVGYEAPLGSCHVLTGGEVSIRARRTWPRGLRPALRHLAVAGSDGRASVTGICFGAQALAEALSRGAVDCLPTLRVGLTDVVMADGSGEQVVPAFHYERIRPRFLHRADTLSLAEASFPAVQGYLTGVALRGYQFHPELDADDVVTVAETHADLLAAFGQDPEEVAVEASLTRDRLDPALFERTVVAPLQAYLSGTPTVVRHLEVETVTRRLVADVAG